MRFGGSHRATNLDHPCEASNMGVDKINSVISENQRQREGIVL